LFPEIWKKSNPAIRQLQETIEDSWDHDGDLHTPFSYKSALRSFSLIKVWL